MGFSEVPGFQQYIRHKKIRSRKSGCGLGGTGILFIQNIKRGGLFIYLNFFSLWKVTKVAIKGIQSCLHA